MPQSSSDHLRRAILPLAFQRMSHPSDHLRRAILTKQTVPFLLEITRIESQCSKCSLEDRNQNLLRQNRNIFLLLSCENQKNLCFSYQYQKLVQKFSNQLKYLQKVGVVSRFSSIMLEKCLILLEKCSVLLKNFFKTKGLFI